MNPPQPRERNRQAKRTVSIIGTGSYVPERVLTNAVALEPDDVRARVRARLAAATPRP